MNYGKFTQIFDQFLKLLKTIEKTILKKFETAENFETSFNCRSYLRRLDLIYHNLDLN